MRHRIWLALVGSIGFWLPLALVEILSRNGNFSVALANALPLVTIAAVYWLLRKRESNEGRVVALSFLAGIYAAGPLVMWLTWSAHGADSPRLTGHIRSGGWSYLRLFRPSAFTWRRGMVRSWRCSL